MKLINSESVMFFFLVETYFFHLTHGALDQWGKQFVIGLGQRNFNENNETCYLEIRVVTDHYEGTLVDVMTPRLRQFEGGMRKSYPIRRHDHKLICIPDSIRQLSGFKRDDAILVTSEHDIMVHVFTKPNQSSKCMFTAYPFRVLGTYYQYLSHSDSLMIVIATKAHTKVDISNYPESRWGEKKSRDIDPKQDRLVHIEFELEQYETYIVDTGLGLFPRNASGAIVKASKPIVLMSQIVNKRTDPNREDGKPVYGGLDDQALPSVNWGKMFVFRLPINPMDLHMMLNIVVEKTVESATVNLSIPGQETKLFNISGSKTLQTQLGRAPDERRPIVCTVSVPAYAVLLIISDIRTARYHTNAITKVPPIEQSYNFYILSIHETEVTAYLHIIIKRFELEGLNLRTINGSKPQFPDTVDNSVHKGYVAALCNMKGPGTYILTHVNPATVFIVFVEIFNEASHQYRHVKELGMRFSPINQNCTPTPMTPGDSLDNDCNGRIDEDTSPKDDADLDGIQAEDVAAGGVAGGVGEWSQWDCEGGCNTGRVVRNRRCNNPLPQKGGAGCGNTVEYDDDRECNTSIARCEEDCYDGFWGDSACRNPCPENCERKICHMSTGLCKHGCESGYYGPSCDIPCHEGYGGKNCRTRCSSVCSSSRCHPVTLKCEDDDFGIVNLSMGITFVVIFVVSPLLGASLYCVTIYGTDASERRRTKDSKGGLKSGPQDELLQSFIDNQLQYEDNFLDEEEDDDEDSDDDSSSTSSSSGSSRLPVLERVKEVDDVPGAERDDVATLSAKFAKAGRNIIQASRVGDGRKSNDAP